jgi:hypothetical protein
VSDFDFFGFAESGTGESADQSCQRKKCATLHGFVSFFSLKTNSENARAVPVRKYLILQGNQKSLTQ